MISPSSSAPKANANAALTNVHLARAARATRGGRVCIRCGSAYLANPARRRAAAWVRRAALPVEAIAQVRRLVRQLVERLRESEGSIRVARPGCIHSSDFNFVFNSPKILGPVVVQSVEQIRVEWFRVSTRRLCQFTMANSQVSCTCTSMVRAEKEEKGGRSSPR